ncbi:MAG TPA: UDP-N-acetylmuramoyl-L-alanine--D-glutamate ligase [Gammaproteobacteria bacterium]|nr:UDP-N-acetylmuramoyl-L-alanine--D-glutamate ligase [Gammaproteobacteria bacterium]
MPTVIVGMGKTGLSCARFLSRRGEPFAIVDSREDPPSLAVVQREFPRAPCHAGDLRPDWLQGARRVLLSPGVPPQEPALCAARAHGAEILGDIELFARHARAPVVAVTGVNGKSTVTTLVGEMARAAGVRTGVGGNLGTPALDLLDEKVSLYVLELSSFQLETVSSLNARVATVLNVSPDHMDRYRSLTEYAATKQRVFRGDGVMVLNADDPLVMAMREQGRTVRRFGLNAPPAGDYGVRQDADGRVWLVCGEERLLPVAELKIKGAHNIANALAAWALAEAAGLPRPAIGDALRTFAGLPHRCRRVAEIDGVHWYDDSKGTNVGAACAAIVGLAQGLASGRRLIIIAGGDGKGADFSAMASAARGRVRAAVIIGRDGPQIEKVLAPVVPCVRADNMEDAVAQAAARAEPGDIVLLSPACASFDMYRDYVHRGEVYVASVRARVRVAASAERQP